MTCKTSCFFLLFALAAIAPSGFARERGTVPVHLEVVADSTNSITAQLQVEVGTNGRELMDSVFKMEYQDFTRRFVIGIAGFKAQAREKKFWKLEIDGASSPVGIAEVVIRKPVRIRWSVASFGD